MAKRHRAGCTALLAWDVAGACDCDGGVPVTPPSLPPDVETLPDFRVELFAALHAGDTQRAIAAFDGMRSSLWNEIGEMESAVDGLENAVECKDLQLEAVSHALESLVDTDLAHDDPERAASIVAEIVRTQAARLTELAADTARLDYFDNASVPEIREMLAYMADGNGSRLIIDRWMQHAAIDAARTPEGAPHA